MLHLLSQQKEGKEQLGLDDSKKEGNTLVEHTAPSNMDDIEMDDKMDCMPDYTLVSAADTSAVVIIEQLRVRYKLLHELPP